MSSPTALPVETKGPVTLDELAVRGLVIGGRVIDLIRGTGPGGAEFGPRRKYLADLERSWLVVD